MLLLLPPLLALSSREARRSAKVGSMRIEDLEALEAQYLKDERRPPPRLGRECEMYRWTQDGTHVHVDIPLPNAPPHTDVSLVIGSDEFAANVVQREKVFDGVRGSLGGAIWPQKSRWEVVKDPPSLSVTIAKQGGEGYAVMWQTFLVGEVPSPTVRYVGVCDTTGFRFRQFLETVEVEVDLPDGVKTPSVEVENDDTLRIDSFVEERLAPCVLYDRVQTTETAWLVDDGTLHITLRKQQKAWWPSLCRR